MIAFQLESDGRHSATRMRVVVRLEILDDLGAPIGGQRSSAMTIEDFFYSRNVPLRRSVMRAA
jgi:hypothetical protein